MFLIFFLTVVPVHHAEAAQCACATDSLHVRSGAGTNHNVLSTLSVGECLPYLGNSTQAGGYTWLHLDFHGMSAWAVSTWLTTKECSSETVTEAPSTSSSLQLPGCPPIVTRAQWGARAPSAHIGDMPDVPVYVFIHHGEGPECTDLAGCVRLVKAYQNYHMDTHGWPDIGYNFVVGEDGQAYEGRGWTKLGTHTAGYNHNGIAICVIGDFSNKVPNDAALNTVKQLIQCGLSNHKISASYTLKGHRDVGQTSCPGTAYYDLIHSWPHYVAGTGLYQA